MRIDGKVTGDEKINVREKDLAKYEKVLGL
jgi:hypothetical protein